MRYEIRTSKEKRETNLQIILKKHDIKQYEVAQYADMEKWQISQLCTGRSNDMLLSTSKRVCNAINDIINNKEVKDYDLHDVFGG